MKIKLTRKLAIVAIAIMSMPVIIVQVLIEALAAPFSEKARNSCDRSIAALIALPKMVWAVLKDDIKTVEKIYDEFIGEFFD